MRTVLAPFALLAPVGTLILGCSAAGDDGMKAEPAYAACTPEPAALGIDETAPNGQVPATLLAAIPGTLRADFVYESGATTTVTLTLDLGAAQARWVDMVETPPADGVSPAMEMACVDVLEIAIPTTFATDDGVFAYRGTLTYTAADDGSLEAFAQPATTELSSTYDWSAHGVVGEADGTTIDSVDAALNLHLLADGTTEGELSVQVTGHDDEVAWASTEAIGGW